MFSWTLSLLSDVVWEDFESEISPPILCMCKTIITYHCSTKVTVVELPQSVV